MHMQEELLVVGPYGDTISYDAEPGMHLLGEADGVRLLTGQSHELLQRVPPAAVDVFETGSTSPGVAALRWQTSAACSAHACLSWPCAAMPAEDLQMLGRLCWSQSVGRDERSAALMQAIVQGALLCLSRPAAGALLYDARRMFDAGSAKADDTLRSIVDRLPEAVITCLEAATGDLDLLRQTALLKVPHLLTLAANHLPCSNLDMVQQLQPWPALLSCLPVPKSVRAAQAAIYGRAFCGADAVPRLAIRDAAQRLRLLNAMRRCLA